MGGFWQYWIDQYEWSGFKYLFEVGIGINLAIEALRSLHRAKLDGLASHVLAKIVKQGYQESALKNPDLDLLPSLVKYYLEELGQVVRRSTFYLKAISVLSVLCAIVLMLALTSLGLGGPHTACRWQVMLLILSSYAGLIGFLLLRGYWLYIDQVTFSDKAMKKLAQLRANDLQAGIQSVIDVPPGNHKE